MPETSAKELFPQTLSLSKGRKKPREKCLQLSNLETKIIQYTDRVALYRVSFGISSRGLIVVSESLTMRNKEVTAYISISPNRPYRNAGGREGGRRPLRYTEETRP